MPNRIIIALHSPAHARRLQLLLQKEGVSTEIKDIQIDAYADEKPVAMEIDIENLPAALRIIENIEIFPLDDSPATSPLPKGKGRPGTRGKKSPTTTKRILLPVDFSEVSLIAARFAFPLAKSLGARIVLIHSFVIPSMADNLSLAPDSISYQPDDMSLDMTLEETSKAQMDRFTERLKQYIKEGVIPPVKFDVEILEGLPESAINDYARETEPLLVVMGTQGSMKKDRDIVGSITAEVLDTSRFPVFTVPLAAKPALIDSRADDIAFFCNLDGADITALNALAALFPDEKFHVSFYHIVTRKEKFSPFSTDDDMAKLVSYCRSKFRGYTFDMKRIEADKAREFFRQPDFLKARFIVLPNKRRTALARLFKPSLPHRLLFHTDIPMLVVPA